MKLYLVHTGYYDKSVGGGFYEQHINIFIVAKNVSSAREKVKKNQDYIAKKMHIDGIKEVNNIDGYDIQLIKNSKKLIPFNH